jgi:hypothetical protein
VAGPVENVLMLSLLAYAHELKDRTEFTDAAPRVVLQANELKMAKLLTEAMSIEDPELTRCVDAGAFLFASRSTEAENT